MYILKFPKCPSTKYDAFPYFSSEPEVILRITPPLIVDNLLPCAFRYHISQENANYDVMNLEKGDSAYLYEADPRKEVKITLTGIPGYNESKPHMIHSAGSVADSLELQDMSNKSLKLSLDNR